MAGYTRISVILWLLCASVPAWGDDATEALTIAPQMGTRSEYTFSMKYAAGAGRKDSYQVVIYRPSGAPENAVVILTAAKQARGGFPMQPIHVIRFDKEGRPKRGENELRAQVFSSVMETLFIRFSPPEVRPGIKWQSKEARRNMRHEIREPKGKPLFLEIKSEYETGGGEVGARGLSFRDRRVVFEPEQRHPISVTTVEKVNFGEGREQTLTLEMRESKRTVLTDGDQKSLAAEIPRLYKLQKVASAQFLERLTKSGGVVRRSPGGGKPDRAKKSHKTVKADPFVLVEAYKKDFPHGLLTPEVKRFGDYLKARNKLLSGRSRTVSRPRVVDEPAQKFSLPDLTGAKVSIDEFKGKVVVLNFFGIACKPCMIEAPFLSKLQEKYHADGLVVLSVHAFEKESKDQVSRLVAGKGLKQKVLLKGSDIARKYGVDVYPTTFFIDRAGKIVSRSPGFSATHKEQLEKKIRALLNR